MAEEIETKKFLVRVATTKGLEFLGMVEEEVINDENYVEACVMSEAMKIFEIQHQSADREGNVGINLTTVCQPFGDIDSPTSINGICAINVASDTDRKMYEDTFKRLRIDRSGIVLPVRSLKVAR